MRKQTSKALIFFTLLCIVNGQGAESAPTTLNEALVGTAVVAVVAVLANVIQFAINAGLLLELKKAKMAQMAHLRKSKTGKASSRSNKSPRINERDLTERSVKIELEETEAIDHQSSPELKTVSCLAYGKFTRAEAEDIDEDDYL